jgi:hypothetical protein
VSVTDELRQLVDKRVTLTLEPRAPGAPRVTGRIMGVLDALDGMSVTLEPDGAPGTRQTYHYHYILAVTPEPHRG